MFTNTEEFHDRKIPPPQLFDYALKNTADMFYYKTAFEKVKNKENPIASTFTNNWVYHTEFSLPGMLRWSEVVEQPPMQELSPIVITVDMMQRKNWDYEMMLMRLEEDSTQISTNDLEQNLYGVIIPTVGGGIPNIEKAFLTEQYEKENPSDKDLIEQLKNEIMKQIHILDKMLPFYEKRAEADKTRELTSKTFEEFHKKSRKHFLETYGPEDDKKREEKKAMVMKVNLVVVVPGSLTISFSSRHLSSIGTWG